MIKRDYYWLYALRLTDGAFSTLNQELPWPKNKTDMKFFVETTASQNIICSEGTFLSILGNTDSNYTEKIERLIKQRRWYVMWKDEPIVKTLPHPRDCIEEIENSEREVFVIGGQRAFREFNNPRFILMNLITAEPDNNSRHNLVSPSTNWSNYKHIRQRVLEDDVLSILLERKT